MAIDRSKKELKAPDSEYLTSLQTELGDLYLQQDNDIDLVREQREMRKPALSEADKDYILVHVDPRDPDITEEAWQQTAILTLERPKLSIVGGEGDTAQTVASKLEHFTEETFWECGTREPGSDTMTQVTDATLNDGGGWAKLLWSSDLWSERYGLASPKSGDPTEAYTAYDKMTEEAKKRAGPPFVWQYVDPRRVYPQWSNGYLCEVLEVSEMPMRSAFRRYRLSRDDRGNIVPEELGQSQNVIEASRNMLSSVTFLEHWDDTYVSYAICSQNFQNDPTGYIVKQFKHKYSFGVPYDYAPGLTMNHWRNRKVGWGIGRTKLWLVQYREYLRAMHAQYVARDLLSPLVTYGDTPAAAVIGDDGLPKETDPTVHPGEILNLPPGRQLQRIQYPDAATLEKHMALIDSAIRDLESPRVTTLSGMEGAGFAISQVLSYSRTRVGPIRHGIESLLKGQTEKLWTLIRERANEKVWVFSGGVDVGSGTQVAEFIGFGPKDLERPMRIKWAVQAQLPTDELMVARYWHERLQAGTAGRDEAVGGMGDNPDEIRRSIARDQIRASEPYKKWLYAEVFMNAGRGDLLQKAQEAEQMALGGQLGAGGAAPTGGLAPGVFEGAPGGVPDLAALAAAPNGTGVQPPPGAQVMRPARPRLARERQSAEIGIREMCRNAAPQTSGSTTAPHIGCVLLWRADLKMFRTAARSYVTHMPHDLSRFELEAMLEFEHQPMDTLAARQSVTMAVECASPQPATCRQVADDLAHETLAHWSTRSVALDEPRQLSSVFGVRPHNLPATAVTWMGSRIWHIRVLATAVANDKTSRWLQDARPRVAFGCWERSTTSASAGGEFANEWLAGVLNRAIARVRTECPSLDQRPGAAKHHAAARARPLGPRPLALTLSRTPRDRAFREQRLAHAKQRAALATRDSNTLISHRWLTPSVSGPRRLNHARGPNVALSVLDNA